MTLNGQLPDGWTHVKFGDVAKQSKEKVDPETSGLERVVRGGDMDTDDLKIRRWDLISNGYLGPAFHRKFTAGQILYGSRRTYLRKVAVADFDGICANTTFVIEARPKKIHPPLLPFIMQSEPFTEHSIRNSRGSTNPYVNWKDLAKYEFALPPLDEQRRIAEILWAVEDTIREYEVISDELEKLSKLVSNTYFSKIYKEKQLFSPLKYLIREPISNGIFKKRKDFGRGIKLINVSDIYSGFRVDPTDLERVDADEVEQEKHSAIAGDVIFNRSSLVYSGVGHATLVPEHTEPFVYECHLMRVRTDTEKILPDFLTRYALSKIGRKFLESRAKTTTMTTINQQDLSEMLVPVVDIPEQEDLINQLDEIDFRREHTEDHLNHLKTLKAGLLNDWLG